LTTPAPESTALPRPVIVPVPLIANPFPPVSTAFPVNVRFAGVWPAAINTRAKRHRRICTGRMNGPFSF